MAWYNLWGNQSDLSEMQELSGGYTDMVDAHEFDAEYELGQEVDKITYKVARAIRRAGERKHETEDALEPFRDYYLVAAIDRLILTDVLQKRNHTDDLLSFVSKDKDIQDALDIFEDSTDWEQLITDILPDLLFHGEYHLRLDSEQYVEDDVPQGKHITAYKRGVVFGHYLKDEKKTQYSSSIAYKLKDAKELAHFSLNAFRERIDLNSKSTNRGEKLPSAIRVGVSYFRAVKDLLSSLKDSEVALDAAQLNNMASDNIVGVEMPSNTSPAAALRITARYQKMLNASKTALTQSGQLSVAKVISALGQIKVLPLYTGGGGNSKGSLSKLDVKSDTSTSEILDNIKNKRDAILGTLGIPPGIIFSGIDQDAQQANTLKRYSRYSKSLTIIQNGIIQGINQLAYAYVAAKTDKDFDKKDIMIGFNYKQPELSMLDHLEIVSTSLQSLQDLDEYLAGLVQDDTVNDLVTASIRKEVIVRNLSLVIGRNLMASPEEDDDTNIFKVKKPSEDAVEYTSDEIDDTWPEISRRDDG